MLDPEQRDAVLRRFAWQLMETLLDEVEDDIVGERAAVLAYADRYCFSQRFASSGS